MGDWIMTFFLLAYFLNGGKGIGEEREGEKWGEEEMEEKEVFLKGEPNGG